MVINNLIKRVIILIWSLSFLQCNNDKCYQIWIDKGSVLEQGSPVILDNGIIGYIDEVANSDTSSIAKFCIPPKIQIPSNSKIYVGLILPFNSNGVKISSSNEEAPMKNSKVLKGILMDSIQLEFNDQDTTLTKELIDLLKDHNEKQKK